MANDIVNVGRAIVLITLRDGRKIRMPIVGGYMAKTRGPDLEHLTSIRMPIPIDRQFEQLKERWKVTNVIEHGTEAYLMKDVVNLELIEVGEYYMVVP